MISFQKINPLLIFLTLLPVLSAWSLPADTLKIKRDSTQSNFFYNDIQKTGTLNLYANDTAITGVQNYDPIFRSSYLYTTLGNIGTPGRDLVPYPFMQSSGFDYGLHTFDPYLFQNDSVRYYKVFKAYTELKYVQGAKKELFFNVLFSRNVYRSLNIGFNFRVFNSPGGYARQRTNAVNFYLTIQFFTKDKRYGMIANLLINRLKNYENGGIKYDSLFEQNLESNRELYAINLNNAQNRVTEAGFYMKHFLNLTSHPKNPKDSAYLARRHFELGRIFYSFEFNRQTQNYIDYSPQGGFYPNIYLDTVKSYDSLMVRKVVNIIGWTNPSFSAEKKKRLLQLEFALKQQYIEVQLHGKKDYFYQYIPFGNLSFNPFISLHLDAYADYVLGDYNGGDMSLRVNLSQTLGKPDNNVGMITLKGYYAFQKPGFFYQQYLGNNFYWNNAWQQQGMISGCFDYSIKNIHAGISISRINHYIYLDSAALPKQFNNEFGYIYGYLKGDLDLWRFKLRAEFAYQTIQGTNVLRLPAFLGNLTIYYAQELFHHAATFQPGLNFFYNSSYHADAYMPALRSFYLQDKKQVGNYLYMDVFINLKIQRARIFAIYTHFNSAFMGRTYYMVPFYPMQDAAFKFGLSWRFYD